MSRRSMPYHRRYQQDALQGYRRLSLEERGAYTTILDLIYDEGGPIDHNERWLAGELNCSLRKARALIDELIAQRKIYITSGGKISNHRAETELENALKISRKCSENVMKREEKKREKSEISNKINKNSERSINNRSTIPNTSTIYNKLNSEYDVEQARKRTSQARSVAGVSPESETLEPITNGAVFSNAIEAVPIGDDQSLASPQLLASLNATPERRAAMHSLVAHHRQRRH
jgi:uncharacterized protein YdaU (DUF1376 family)